MSSPENAYVCLDPTGSVDAAGSSARPIAERPASLDGAVVGLLANGKVNSEPLLECIYAELGQRYSLAGAIRHRKGSVSVPPTPEAFDQLVREATVVVTATGD